MGADQQFCLRWNNFHTNITSAFESLRDDEDFVDITLACEGRQIKAHKMVLSACSPYFRNLLRGNPCQHPIVFLKDVSFANLTSILDFMYHGEVNVSHNELASFLKTAEALRVRGLAEDEKKRDRDTCTESSSPPPPRDPPEPCSPGRPEEPPGEGGGGGRISIISEGGGGRSSSGPCLTPTGDTSAGGGSGSNTGPPPAKRQRRRSGASAPPITNPSSADQHDTNTSELIAQQQTDNVSRETVKNEPEDYVSEENMLEHQQISSEDIKLDGFAAADDSTSDYNMACDSVSITSRNAAAMQQLQDTFNTFIPGMSGQSPGGGGFLPHSAAVGSDHGRPHPSFSLEGVQGLPPGISTLPGPSMSQGGSASQDASGQGHMLYYDHASKGQQHNHHHHQQPPPLQCPYCAKTIRYRSNLRKHIADMHSGVYYQFTCDVCNKLFRTKNSLLTHTYRQHPGHKANVTGKPVAAGNNVAASDSRVNNDIASNNTANSSSNNNAASSSNNKNSNVIVANDESIDHFLESNINNAINTNNNMHQQPNMASSYTTQQQCHYSDS